MENKKTKYNMRRTEKIALVLCFLLLFTWFFAGNSQAAAPGTDIEVCVQPPDPDLSDQNSPILQYLTKYHPFFYYQIQISKDPAFSSILYDTTEQAYSSTFSYKRAVTTSCSWIGCTSTPTIINGHPAPRCACDSNVNTANCPASYGALPSDPAVCYDWWTQTMGYSCSWTTDIWGNMIYTCNCAYGGTCPEYSCNWLTDPWGNPYFGCTCSDGTTPAPTCVWDDSSGWICSYGGNTCDAPYSYQYNNTEIPTGMPVGTYSYTMPPGTLPIDNSTYYYQVRVKDAYDWSPYAVGNFFLGMTDGVCGSGLSFCDGATIDASTPGLCSPGTPNITSSTNPWAWTCLGLYGGADSSQCSAAVTPVTDCGTMTACSGDVLSCQPSMCSNGGTCTMTGDTTWTCTDSCGTNKSCSATIQPTVDAECGTADGTPICDGRSLTGAELCAGGSPNPADPDTTGYEASWQCLGSCGGTPVNSCSAQGRKSCGWIETNP